MRAPSSMRKTWEKSQRSPSELSWKSPASRYKPSLQILAIALSCFARRTAPFPRLTADHGELYKVVRSGAITIAKYNATQDVIDRATSKQQLRQLATEAGLGPDSVEFSSVSETLSVATSDVPGRLMKTRRRVLLLNLKYIS